jgi:hypothetical protein
MMVQMKEGDRSVRMEGHHMKEVVDHKQLMVGRTQEAGLNMQEQQEEEQQRSSSA